MFRLTNHHQGAYCRALLKLWLLKGSVNSLNTELKPIWHLMALLGAHLILYFRRIRVKIRRYEFSSKRRI